MLDLKLVLFTLAIFKMAAILDGQTLGGPMHGKAVVCYVATWAAYRQKAAQFTIEDLDPSLCTHLVYSFAGLDEKTMSIKSLDNWQDLEKDYGKAGYKRMVNLKQRYPHLKVTIAIGGWNEGSEKYSTMASKPETRATFIRSVMQFLKQYKFDGLDLDWEYPGKRGGRPEDKTNYVALVKELKEAFESQEYILTAALGVGRDTMEAAYDLARLSKYLDLIHMMCYDYHGTWDGFVGANAPLRGTSEEDFLSVEQTIKYMLEHGVSPYKMVLGLPLYGRNFILTQPDARNIEYGVTSVQNVGFKGPLTGEAGFMGYHEICMARQNETSTWKYYWHDQSSTPYLRDGQRVITYDDARSIAIKVKMAIDYNLGGLMVWSIDTDDFKGVCEADTDAFVDFTERYKTMVDDPVLAEALKTLNLPDATRHGKFGHQSAYTVSNGRLVLDIPVQQIPNYPIMRTINMAAKLALEEKRIEDEMKRVTEENVIDDEKAPGSGNGVASSLSMVLLCYLIVDRV